MISPRIKRGDPEKVFIVVRNARSVNVFGDTGVTLSNGDVVKWDTAVASAGVSQAANYGTDVLDCVATTDADTVHRAGVIHGKDIIPGEYGLMQVYGYKNDVKMDNSVAVGSIVTMGATAKTSKGTAKGGGWSVDQIMGRIGMCMKASGSTGRGGVMIDVL